MTPPLAFIAPLAPLARRPLPPRSASRRRPRGPTMRWVSRSAETRVPRLPPGAVYAAYADLERMPAWSPWLLDVRALPGGASEWSVGARGVRLSWRAVCVVEDPGRLIAWESVSGLRNRGRVEFWEGGDGTGVRLTVEVDAPERVAGLVDGTAKIGQFVEETLRGDLERFREIVVADAEMQGGVGEEEVLAESSTRGGQ